jgi:sugar phosphate isomerase/epimerase
MQSPNISRRDSILAAAATLCTPLLARSAMPVEKAAPICVFTKPFNSLSFDVLADKIAELGFDGIEAPIRVGGHIEPTEVEAKLPLLVDALQKRGLEVTVMTTDINDPRDPLTVRVLKTAAELGIRRYRMNYMEYDLKQRSVSEQLKAWHPQFLELAELNEQLGIRGLYQNHASSKLLGGALWDLSQVLQGISVGHLGVAYDIRHATVEGGMSWGITFNMIRPHIDTVYVKDFIWSGAKLKNVPLGEGMIDPRFFKLLRESEFAGPISMHEEYLDHTDATLVPAHLHAMKQDLSVLRSWLS